VGKFPRFNDRLLSASFKVANKFNIPFKPLRVLGKSSALIKNSLKILSTLPRLTSRPLVNSGSEDILITGWYGTETLGDKAILFSIIQDLVNAGISPSTIFVASIEPYVTEYTLSEFSSASSCSVISLSEAKSVAQRGGFVQVIFGGGPIMSSIGYLCDIASIFASVKSFGGQAIIWGCGVGPIRKLKRDLVNKLALSRILRSADFCVFRDQASLDLAKNLVGSHLGNYSKVAIDPAFHWVESHPRSDSRSGKVGFAVRSLPLKEYYSDFAGESGVFSSHFNRQIVALMELHNKNAPVYLQCMHRLPCGGDDRMYYNDILGDKIESFEFSFEHISPSDDIRLLSSLDLLYAMRFHSLVFAAALGVPVIPIDYTNGGKITALCKLLDIRSWTPSDVVDLDLSCGETLQPQTVSPELLTRVVSESSSTYADLAQKVACFVSK
jgi:polysaccharide pyruvyl transferase WcaK-like protein